MVRIQLDLYMDIKWHTPPTEEIRPHLPLSQTSDGRTSSKHSWKHQAYHVNSCSSCSWMEAQTQWPRRALSCRIAVTPTRGLSAVDQGRLSLSLTQSLPARLTLDFSSLLSRMILGGPAPAKGVDTTQTLPNPRRAAIRILGAEPGGQPQSPRHTRSGHAACVIPGSGFLVSDWSCLLAYRDAGLSARSQCRYPLPSLVSGWRLAFHGCGLATLIYKST